MNFKFARNNQLVLDIPLSYGMLAQFCDHPVFFRSIWGYNCDARQINCILQCNYATYPSTQCAFGPSKSNVTWILKPYLDPITVEKLVLLLISWSGLINLSYISMSVTWIGSNHFSHFPLFGLHHNIFFYHSGF